MNTKLKYILYALAFVVSIIVLLIIQNIPKYEAENKIIETIFTDNIDSEARFHKRFSEDTLKIWRTKKKSEYNGVYFLEQYHHFWKFGKVNQNTIDRIKLRHKNSRFLIRNKNDYVKKEIHHDLYDDYLLEIQIVDKITNERGEILSIDHITWISKDTVSVYFSSYLGTLSSHGEIYTLVYEDRKWEIIKSDLDFIS